MTKVLDAAIDVLRELPKDLQAAVARAIVDYASHDESVYYLTHDERAEVRAGVAELERGEIASDRAVARAYSRAGRRSRTPLSTTAIRAKCCKLNSGAQTGCGIGM